MLAGFGEGLEVGCVTGMAVVVGATMGTLVSVDLYISLENLNKGGKGKGQAAHNILYVILSHCVILVQ